MLKKLKLFFQKLLSKNPAWKTDSNPLKDINSLISRFETKENIHLTDWQKDTIKDSISGNNSNTILLMPRGFGKATINRAVNEILEKYNIDLPNVPNMPNRKNMITARFNDEIQYLKTEDLMKAKEFSLEWDFQQEYLAEFKPDQKEIDIEEKGFTIIKCENCGVEMHTINIKIKYCSYLCALNDYKKLDNKIIFNGDVN